MRLLVPPPAVALVAAAAQRALAGGPSARSAGRTASAAVLSAASLSMSLGAIGTFFRSGTTVEPFRPDEASVLVTTGANALTRNPMYVGLTGLLVAHALWRGSWAALAPVAGFVGVIDRLQVEAEESALVRKFGAEYETYRATTPRWLGPRSLARSSGVVTVRPEHP